MEASLFLFHSLQTDVTDGRRLRKAKLSLAQKGNLFTLRYTEIVNVFTHYRFTYVLNVMNLNLEALEPIPELPPIRNL